MDTFGINFTNGKLYSKKHNHYSSSDKNPPAFNPDSPLGKELQNLRINSVLHLQDAGSEGIRRIIIMDGDTFLQDDGPAVVPFIHKMDGDAAHLAAVIQNRFMDVMAVHALSSEQWQQRRMDIDDPVSKKRNDLRRDSLHIACQNNQIGFMFFQDGNQLIHELQTDGKIDTGDNLGRDAMLTGDGQRAGVRIVGNQHADLGAEAALIDGIQDGGEIRSPAGGKNAQT